MITPTLIVVDDVSPLADEIRNSALAFEGKEVESAGITYPGVIREEGLEQMMRDHMGPIIAQQMGRSVVPLLTFFRLGTADHDPAIYIHSDNIEKTSHAAVFYLTPDSISEGGTAFWRHKELGLDYLPRPEDLEQMGIKWDQSFCDKINTEGRDESFWTMVGLVGARYNRMTIYPGGLFHSRYPQHYAGTTPETGRLVWVCFFKFS